MFDENQFENRIQKNQSAMDELLIQNESLDREVGQLLDELQVAPEQLSRFIADQSNFTPENWEQLKREQQKQQDKLQRDLAHIANPRQSKKTRAQQRSIQQHWLFVR